MPLIVLLHSILLIALSCGQGGLMRSGRNDIEVVPPGTTYNSPQSVRFQVPPNYNGSIWYTFDGSDPTNSSNKKIYENNSSFVVGEANRNSSVQVRFVLVDPLGKWSDEIFEERYVFQPDLDPPKLIVNPNGGTWRIPPKITIMPQEKALLFGCVAWNQACEAENACAVEPLSNEHTDHWVLDTEKISALQEKSEIGNFCLKLYGIDINDNSTSLTTYNYKIDNNFPDISITISALENGGIWWLGEHLEVEIKAGSTTEKNEFQNLDFELSLVNIDKNQSVKIEQKGNTDSKIWISDPPFLNSAYEFNSNWNLKLVSKHNLKPFLGEQIFNYSFIASAKPHYKNHNLFLSSSESKRNFSQEENWVSLLGIPSKQAFTNDFNWIDRQTSIGYLGTTEQQKN